MTHQSLYLEINYTQGNFERLECAWEMVIARHPLLQQYRTLTGELRQSDNYDYPIALYDMRNQPTGKIAAIEKILRDNLTNIPCADTEWPWFVVKAAIYDSGDVRFFMSFAPSMLSSQQIYYLLREWSALYQNPKATLHPLTLTPPTKPSIPNYELRDLRYQHLMGRLDHNTFAALRDTSNNEHISLSLAIATIFSDQMMRQDLNYPFYITLANRFPLYPYSFDQAFFATSLASASLTIKNTGTLQERCQAAESDLRKTSTTLDAAQLNTLIAPQQPELFNLFSCNLEQNLAAGPLYAKPADIIFSNFSLPLPVIDISVWEQAGQLLYRWSYLDVDVVGQSMTKEMATLSDDMPLDKLFSIKLDDAAMPAKKKIILDPGVVLLGAGFIKGNYTQPSEENLVPLDVEQPATVATATQKIETPMLASNASEKIAGNETTADAIPNATDFAVNTPSEPKISGISALEKTIGSAIVGTIASTIVTQASASSASSAAAIPASAAVANTQAANTAAFSGSAHQLTQLSIQPATWQAPNTAPLASQASMAAKPSAGYVSALQQMPPSSPHVGLAQQLSNIRNTPVSAPDLSKITPPTVDQLSTMSPSQMQQSYQQYSEARANVLAPQATSAATSGSALSIAFGGILVGAGSAAALIKPQTSDMGQNLDGLNTALAKGDQAAVNSQLDSIQKLHEDIVTKMGQNNIPADSAQNPLHQQSSQLQDSLDQVAKKQDAASVQDFNAKTDAFSAEYDKHAQIAQPADTKVITGAEQSITDAQEQQKTSPKFQEVNQSVTNLQADTTKLGTFNCSNINSPEAQQTMANIKKESQHLQSLIPDGTNPLAKQMADAQANATKVQSAAAGITPPTISAPSMPSVPTGTAPDPTADLQKSAQGLANHANELAGHIQGKCPICAHGLPNMPAPQPINAHLPALVNPFTVPLSHVTNMLNKLNAMKNTPNMPDLSAAQSKLQAMQSKMQGYGPDAAINKLSQTAQNAAANNPWQKYSGQVSDLQSKLTSFNTQFTTNCPNYSTVVGSASSPAQNIQGALSNLAGCQNQLASLTPPSNPVSGVPDPSQFLSSAPSTTDSLNALQSGLFSTLQQVGGNPAIGAGLKQSLADAAAGLSNSLICNKHQLTGGFPPLGGGAPATPQDLVASGAQIQCAGGAGPQNLNVLPLGANTDNKPTAKITDYIPYVGTQAAPQCIAPTHPVNIAKMAIGVPPGAPCIPLQLPLPPYTKNTLINNLPLPVRQTPSVCGLCGMQAKIINPNTNGAVAS